MDGAGNSTISNEEKGFSTAPNHAVPETKKAHRERSGRKRTPRGEGNGADTGQSREMVDTSEKTGRRIKVKKETVIAKHGKEKEPCDEDMKEAGGDKNEKTLDRYAKERKGKAQRKRVSRKGTKGKQHGI